MQKVLSYIKSLWQWIVQGKFFWGSFLTVVIFLVVVYIGDLKPKKEFFIYVGLILQIFGLLTLLLGLNAKITRFTLSNPLKYHFSYFGRFPRFKGKNITLQAQSTTTTTTTTEADLRLHISEDADTEKKIAYILQELEKLNDLIIKQKRLHHNDIIKLTRVFNDYKNDTDHKLDNLQRTLEDINVGSVDLELFGIFCFFLGIILSTIPEQIASLF